MKLNVVRTLLAILICLSLLICMLACGDNETNSNESGSTQVTDEQTQAPDQNNEGNGGDGQKTEEVTAGFSKNY